MPSTSAQISVFEEQVISDLQQLQLYYDGALQTGIFLERAQTLRTQIAEGGEGAAQSSAAALQLLKMRLNCQRSRAANHHLRWHRSGSPAASYHTATG